MTYYREDTEWHGWSKRLVGVENPRSLHVGLLPGRKSICLYAVEGSVITALAYFRNEESAAHALELIDYLTGLADV